jgi:Zn-dependent M28 family amino/carboxypeptidase
VAYLNFDMLGSPNAVPAIHNGTDTPTNVRCRTVHAPEHAHTR